MDKLFANRIQSIPSSFIREILNLALQPDMISFAGGLPSSLLFPVEELRAATDEVFAYSGIDVLQYGGSAGDPNLKEWISARYLEKQGITIPTENILITSGSQQGLDLLGKVLINKQEFIGIESPGYLGAIQAFSVYQPNFEPLPVDSTGMNIKCLKTVLAAKPLKLIYTVANFQNPSGIHYSEDNKHAVANALRQTNILLIDDDPYGELRFSGKATTPFWRLLPEQVALLGSFSKIIAPGLRLGWIAAPKPLIDKLLIAKQAADLHTSLLPQKIIHQYLCNHSLDVHIAKITHHYGKQCKAMLTAIDKEFPKNVRVTRPQGGMFLWATLPAPLLAKEVFELAVKEKVVFVPGDPFYTENKQVRSMRLNFTCVDEASIQRGIERLGRVIRSIITS